MDVLVCLWQYSGVSSYLVLIGRSAQGCKLDGMDSLVKTSAMSLSIFILGDSPT